MGLFTVLEFKMSCQGHLKLLDNKVSPRKLITLLEICECLLFTSFITINVGKINSKIYPNED